MSMMEYFEAGYEVVCGSMWGDVKMEDADMVECYMEDGDMELQYVDEDAKSVYYYEVDYGQYDDQVARPFFHECKHRRFCPGARRFSEPFVKNLTIKIQRKTK